MARKFKELLDKLSPERQAQIQAGAAKMIAEMALLGENDPNGPKSDPNSGA